MEEQWTYKTDDSGAIHSAKQTYKITKEDGWQANRGYHRSMMSPEEMRTRPQMIKGTQVGMHYETDDYRVVIPVLIVFGIIITAVCVLVTIIIPPFGVFFDVMWVAAIVGIIRQRPDKKWRAQAKRRKEAKENGTYRD